MIYCSAIHFNSYELFVFTTRPLKGHGGTHPAALVQLEIGSVPHAATRTLPNTDVWFLVPDNRQPHSRCAFSSEASACFLAIVFVFKIPATFPNDRCGFCPAITAPIGPMQNDTIGRWVTLNLISGFGTPTAGPFVLSGRHLEQTRRGEPDKRDGRRLW